MTAPATDLGREIAELDVIEPPPGWAERVVERWERERRPASPEELRP